MNELNNLVSSQSRVRKNNIVNLSFMRLCSNVHKESPVIEDERDIEGVMVDIEHQDNVRIESFYFEDYLNADFQHLKQSTQDAKDINPADYISKYNRYIVYVGFNSECEVDYGGDISVSKNMCYVDEINNAIVFVCPY